jgi:hypothetical protein
LKAAEVNLSILEEEPDEGINLFWKRMILLRMAFCLLGLDYKGSPIAGLIPDKYQTVKAKTLLTDVYKTTLHKRNLPVQRMILHKMNFLSHFEYVFRHLQIFHRLNKQEFGVTHSSIPGIKACFQTGS